MVKNDILIAGIKTRTTNNDSQAMADIGAMWQEFFSKNILSAIDDRVSNDIYLIYTNYESDYLGYYDAILGLQVSDFTGVASGFFKHTIQAGKYKKYLAKGQLPDAVINVWKEIWKADVSLNRIYGSDFEIYTDKALNKQDAEVEIMIGIR